MKIHHIGDIGVALNAEKIAGPRVLASWVKLPPIGEALRAAYEIGPDESVPERITALLDELRAMEAREQAFNPKAP